jgi:hypothetical protein
MGFVCSSKSEYMEIERYAQTCKRFYYLLQKHDNDYNKLQYINWDYNIGVLL